ncbi:MAG: membrane protein insertion efficiency factor YidD [Candidatus Marinimicrobia bacterium]|nr:membrane protein insertion efficiency factor YidD [Candidatus Neomarinimicrobiota bacterium]MCH8836303.1 membrane protein insertion efficiency factor YidD [Candidatus Neomarinimicrobiota bacterium]
MKLLTAIAKSSRRVAIAALVLLIRLYQNSLSLLFPGACRYEPSCSQYAIDALRKYGLLGGSGRAVQRILRCHPYSKHSAHDPA